MDILFDGVKEFNRKDFKEYKDLFQDLDLEQNPHTLFISCCDSRVLPELITNSKPGDLFVVRNVANLVPHYRVSSEYLSTTAAIEYAIQVLEVENIIVCGHSNCGGCKALKKTPEELESLPHTGKWIELANNAKKMAERLVMHMDETDSIDWLIEQENIVEQMNHLLTYPYIKERYKNGSVKIMGWYYEIGKGKVFNYNKKEKIFELIK